jgi:hypothetical protein
LASEELELTKPCLLSSTQKVLRRVLFFLLPKRKGKFCSSSVNCPNWAFGNIIHDHWSASLDFWKYSSQPGVLVMKEFFSKAWAIWPLARWLDSWPGPKSLGAVIHLLENLAEFRPENYIILYKCFLMEKMTQIRHQNFMISSSR